MPRGKPSATARARNPIASLLRVLDAMVESDASSFGVRELARLVDSPPSSVQRTLESGAAVSLVNPTASGQWELGWELYRIASLAQRKQPFLAVMELLGELSHDTGETSFLAVYDHARRERMYVAMAPSPRSVQFVPQLFSWLPLQAAASAMAIVAHLPEEERKDLYKERLPIFAGQRPAAMKIEKILSVIRSEGFALSRDQADVGASGIAAPAWTAGAVNCSIGIAVPNQRFDEAKAGKLIGTVVRTAKIVSRRLGDPLAAVEESR
jgi:DNA-binding IclR family transcriptional regulator